MGEFGSSLEDVTLALNTTCKSRTSERQKLYGESTAALNLLKASKAELDKKQKDYFSKARATDDAMAALAKAKSAAKPKGISKLESKEEKSMNALSVSVEVYEYQLKLTNEKVFELFDETLPTLLEVCINLIKKLFLSILISFVLTGI